MSSFVALLKSRMLSRSGGAAFGSVKAAHCATVAGLHLLSENPLSGFNRKFLTPLYPICFSLGHSGGREGNHTNGLGRDRRGARLEKLNLIGGSAHKRKRHI